MSTCLKTKKSSFFYIRCVCSFVYVNIRINARKEAPFVFVLMCIEKNTRCKRVFSIVCVFFFCLFQNPPIYSPPRAYARLLLFSFFFFFFLVAVLPSTTTRNTPISPSRSFFFFFFFAIVVVVKRCVFLGYWYTLFDLSNRSFFFLAVFFFLSFSPSKVVSPHFRC